MRFAKRGCAGTFLLPCTISLFQRDYVPGRSVSSSVFVPVELLGNLSFFVQ